MTPEIVQPRPGDPDRAEDTLDAIFDVLKTAGSGLLIKDGKLYLCVPSRPDGSGVPKWRAIGEVATLTCFSLLWRPIDWTEARPTN